MNERSEDLRAILIPLADDNLLLPVALVAEVTGFELPSPIANAPPWLAGAMSWRRQSIPVIGFEQAIGRSGSPPTGRRAVVLRVLGSNPNLAFYAVRAIATPRVFRVNGDLLHALAQRPTLPAMVAARVSIGGGEAALIPDLDLLQQTLGELWRKTRD